MKRLGWLLFFLLVIYFIFLIRQDIINYLDLKKEIQLVSKKNEQAEKRAADLKERLQLLKDDDLIEELGATPPGLLY